MNIKTLIAEKWRNKKIVILMTALLLSFSAIILSASATFAGGPANRPTFTSANPADYVVFNAITDNPKHGDERNFVLIREAGVGNYVNEISLQPGKEYQVYSYFHNNAKSRLNTGEGTGIARNARISADVPTVVKPGEKGKISTIITADNANPQKVWDEAYVTSTSTVALRYVPASAVIHSSGAVNGKILPDSLFSTEGTFLGYSQLNGILPGCADYAGYVIYKIKVDQPAFDISKTVSKDSKDWSKEVSAKLGDKISFKITYKNTGTTDQNDVTIKDVLPKGLKYVAGSTNLVNNSNPNGLKVSDNVVTDKGINIGNYGPGASATITFSATIDSDSDIYKCGENTLTNVVSVITSNGTKKDEAKVKVPVECEPNECKPGIPEGDERCDDKPIPGELPTTGPAQIIAAVLGITLISLGVAYWLHSRQALKQAKAGIAPRADSDSTADINKVSVDSKEVDQDK